MTNLWKVLVEVRVIGAIGLFSTKEYTIRAEPADITRYTLDDVAMDGMEPRFIKSIRRA